MNDTIEFGIGFVTGRPNVCNLINNYYKEILNQVENMNVKVNITFFILYDLEYQFTKRTDFYNIIPEVYKNIKIKYITPEDIEEEEKKLMSRQNLKKDDIELLFGHGHAKGRNTVMYFALKRKIDYLLFWDDDEYPLAVEKQDKVLNWTKQNNITEHIKYIENADITIGYHCGYISPIPYIELGEEILEEDFKKYIEAISNEVISWESIMEKMKLADGVTYANHDIITRSVTYEIKNVNIKNAVVGSTLCINLKHYKKIPAFYNPPEARGEDTFFSSLLTECKVIKVPVYHFHDGFLRYTQIMKKRYPKKLKRINVDEESIEHRFVQASLGWIKYKPLYMYISNRDKYKENAEEVRKKLESSIQKLNKLFLHNNLEEILTSFNLWDMKVEQHYNDYIKTNQIWNKVKEQIIENGK